jgi:hypothetical protein
MEESSALMLRPTSPTDSLFRPAESREHPMHVSADHQQFFGLTGCRTVVPDLHPMLEHLHAELRALEAVVGL